MLKSLVNRTYTDLYGPDCSDVVRKFPVETSFYDDKGNKLQGIELRLDRECLIAQVSSVLLRFQRDGDPGTDKLPCHINGMRKGDWDQAVYQLTRFDYLLRRYSDWMPKSAASAALLNCPPSALMRQPG